LAKILQSLNRAGLVQSQRGLGGGITLVQKPSQLNLLQFLNAVEPFKRIRRCPLGLASHGARLCPLHRRLDLALASVEEAFGQTTLAEVLTEPTGSPPLCDLRKVKKRA
jgi:Rrf2 family protein